RPAARSPSSPLVRWAATPPRSWRKEPRGAGSATAASTSCASRPVDSARKPLPGSQKLMTTTTWISTRRSSSPWIGPRNATSGRRAAVSSWIEALGSAPQVGDNQAGVRGARLLGTTIGNYKITAEIGQGGMGIVYLAEHPSLGRKAAVKVLHPRLATEPKTVTRRVSR